MKKKYSLKIFLYAVLGGTILASGCAISAFSFAWFSNNNNVTRVLEVQQQALISLGVMAQKQTHTLLIDQFIYTTSPGYNTLVSSKEKSLISLSKEI